MYSRGQSGAGAPTGAGPGLPPSGPGGINSSKSASEYGSYGGYGIYFILNYKLSKTRVKKWFIILQHIFEKVYPALIKNCIFLNRYRALLSEGKELDKMSNIYISFISVLVSGIFLPWKEGIVTHEDEFFFP